MDNLKLDGIIPAVAVPMLHNFSIDVAAFKRYLEWIVSLGPVAVAVNVDTGEGPYLTPQERVQVIQVARDVTAGRCAVVAGVVGPGTLNAVENAEAARDAGADALLVFPSPAFLNKPLDVRIVYNYHKAIGEASGLPLIVFQLGPIFGGVNYSPDVLVEVLKLPQVQAIKAASFDAQRFVATRNVVRKVDRPITLLTGNDPFLLESFLLGAEGGLLGFGAVGAGMLIDMLNAVKNRDFATAADMQDCVQGFCDYIYGRPTGDYRARCKVALVHIGVLTPDQTYVRPPFLSLWDSEKERAYQAVKKAGLLGAAPVV